MKYFVKIQLCLTAALIFILFSCKKEGKYSLEDTPPLDFRSYYNGLTVTFANATQNASNISWDFGDGSGQATGDSVSHTYSEIGMYVITMKANYQGKDYVFHTVLRVDKPSMIRLDDNSFDDWKSINYPDFQLAGKVAVTKGKVDYDANNIYLFLEYVAPDANSNLENGIMDLFIDADNSSSTGLTLKGLGCDYLLEGNIVAWFDPYVFTGKTPTDWNFANYSISNYYALGYTETSGDTVRMEFSFSREGLKVDKDAFQFALTMMDTNWSEIGTLTTSDYNEKITVMMDKQ